MKQLSAWDSALVRNLDLANRVSHCATNSWGGTRTRDPGIMRNGAPLRTRAPLPIDAPPCATDSPRNPPTLVPGLVPAISDYWRGR